MRWLAPLLVVVFLAAAAACSEPEAPVIVPERAPAPRVIPDPREAVHFPGMQVPLDEIAPELKVACEPGQRKMCRGQIAEGPHPGPHTLYMTCFQGADRMFQWNDSPCNTPLVVSFDETPVQFTKPAGSFTIGTSDRTEWVSSRTPWLALDSDGSGCIDDQRELFGPPAQGGKNGFDKLAALDDDHDGRIDAKDAAYAKLVLWSDGDQDRLCTAREMTRLADAGVVAIELGYATPATPASGSHEGEHATIWVRRPGGELRRGRIVDVYLASLP
jgi:hypothetical protein